MKNLLLIAFSVSFFAIAGGASARAQVVDKTKLIFDRVGDRYFLSEIFEEGSGIGAELKKSSAEQQMEKETAMSQVHSVTVPAKTGVSTSR